MPFSNRSFFDWHLNKVCYSNIDLPTNHQTGNEKQTTFRKSNSNRAIILNKILSAFSIEL